MRLAVRQHRVPTPPRRPQVIVTVRLEPLITGHHGTPTSRRNTQQGRGLSNSQTVFHTPRLTALAWQVKPIIRGDLMPPSATLTGMTVPIIPGPNQPEPLPQAAKPPKVRYTGADKRPTVAILVGLIAFCGSGQLLAFPVPLLLAALCAALAWVLTPKPQP